MSKAGRISKVKLLGYEDEILELRTQGYSFERIAQEMNSRYPDNITIGKDVVFRYFKGLNKKTSIDRPIVMEELIHDIFTEIYYKLKISSLDSKERQALISYMKAKESKLKSKAFEIFTGKSRHTVNSEFEKVRRLILDFSNRICLKCRQRVLDEIEELDRGR